MDALLIIITFALSLVTGLAAGRAVLSILFAWAMQPQATRVDPTARYPQRT